MQKFFLYLVLGCPLGACVADDALPHESDHVLPVPATQGVARPGAGPQLRELKWTWANCAAANLAPLALTVDVSVDSSSATYRIKGEATDCDPFDASGETRKCALYPGTARTLSVSLSEQGYIDQTASTTIYDCVDGSYTVPAPAD